jgi:DNA-binding NtrC family response regulator
MNIQGTKKRILLVEGDPIQRMLLQEYLESVTLYEVLKPKGVFELLSASESPVCRLSLVLLDMEWHRVDGVDLVLEIRKRNPRLPILGMTDRQADLYDDRRLRGLSVAFIRKPFSPYHLHRSISATIKAQSADLTKRSCFTGYRKRSPSNVARPYQNAGATS